jgi:hypothetical protein
MAMKLIEWCNYKKLKNVAAVFKNVIVKPGNWMKKKF